ncbi:MAG: D-alanyl-D-alanine carboxypeptidase [Oscillospiraceae bacterium]|nr:D-alanyl-D-alanine carboxypeptidase [Oscillospiraceae bacterium]
MKRLMLWEVAVLAVLLIATFVVLVTFPSPDFKAEISTTPTATTGPQPTEHYIPTWNTYPKDRVLFAQQYFVYDCKADTFLISSGDAGTQVYPASITKLFTAYVALQYLEPTTQVTAGDALDYVVPGSSVAKLEVGDVLSVELLVEAMMLPSGNDAAYVLACEAGRAIKNNPQLDAAAAKDAFVAEMNTQAAAAGMTGTHFMNPDGIHDTNHYSTFGDLAILGKLALSNKTIMKYAATAKDKVTLHGETVEWKNTNKLVDRTNSYFCPYALGLKTGQTPDAGSCLLSAFRKDNYELIIGVFGCPLEEDRFDDTLQLFNQIVLK